MTDPLDQVRGSHLNDSERHRPRKGCVRVCVCALYGSVPICVCRHARTALCDVSVTKKRGWATEGMGRALIKVTRTFLPPCLLLLQMQSKVKKVEKKESW